MADSLEVHLQKSGVTKDFREEAAFAIRNHLAWQLSRCDHFDDKAWKAVYKWELDVKQEAYYQGIPTGYATDTAQYLMMSLAEIADEWGFCPVQLLKAVVECNELRLRGSKNLEG